MNEKLNLSFTKNCKNHILPSNLKTKFKQPYKPLKIKISNDQFDDEQTKQKEQTEQLEIQKAEIQLSQIESELKNRALKTQNENLIKTEQKTINTLIQSRIYQLDQKSERQKAIGRYNEILGDIVDDEKRYYKKLEALGQEKKEIYEKRFRKFQEVKENMQRSEEIKIQIEACYERIGYYEKNIKEIDRSQNRSAY